MIEKERHVLIMEQLRSDGFVSVKDLMGRLNASRSSIMRDLIALEEAL
jgi:DeoR/GlpR family transcriptional regulator of sugar metabolism